MQVEQVAVARADGDESSRKEVEDEGVEDNEPLGGAVAL